MIFSVKLFPNTIWGSTYQGDLRLLVDEIQTSGVQNIVVPMFQGSRLFFPEDPENASAAFNLLQLQRACHEAGIGFIPQAPVFQDPDTWENIQQYRPIDLQGQTTIPVSWYRPICPTNENYQKYRLDQIIQGMNAFQSPWLSLDFLHYPYLARLAEFEADPTALPKFCYCDFCRYNFLDYSGRANPLEDIEGWYNSRAEKITIVPVLLVEEFEKLGRKVQMIVELPPAAVPGAVENLRRLAGMDPVQWRGLIGVLSPHLHFYQLGESWRWGEDYLRELLEFGSFKIIPELDLPGRGASYNEIENLQQFIENLQTLEIEAITLFHWDLLTGNKAAIDLIKQFSNE